MGNYLGAVREWVRLQNDSTPGTKLLFSIVDLHALTVPQDPGRLKSQRREMFATLIAAGLDPNRSTIFYQSAVCAAVWRPCLPSACRSSACIDCCQAPAHSELMWILSTVASMGYLSRMTQWKVSACRVKLPGICYNGRAKPPSFRANSNSRKT